MKILHVVGARPNFMKLAPVLNAIEVRNEELRKNKGRKNDGLQTVVHTGQHYDVQMSDVFFQQLGLPAPDVNLAVGSGSPAWVASSSQTRN